MKVYYMEKSVIVSDYMDTFPAFETTPYGVYTTLELALNDARLEGCDIPLDGSEPAEGKAGVMRNDGSKYMYIFPMTVIDH